jgi:hypothetical protein
MKKSVRTKKTAPTRKPKLNTTGLPHAQDSLGFSRLRDRASRLSTMSPATRSAAVVALARAWLGKAGFHEDPSGASPERIEIQGPGWEGRSQEHYVDVRVYIPNLDVEHVVDGTHPNGITTEAA